MYDFVKILPSEIVDIIFSYACPDPGDHLRLFLTCKNWFYHAKRSWIRCLLLEMKFEKNITKRWRVLDELKHIKPYDEMMINSVLEILEKETNR